MTSDDASSQTRVLVLSHKGARSYVVPNGATFTVGRHAECEILVEVPSVSRRHARITGADRPIIEDLGGMNGVRLAGRRIPVNEQMPVHAGDVVELGGAILIIQPPNLSGAARLEPHPTSSSDDPMHAVEQLVDLVAQSGLPVLLSGEKGVGKTITAESIHARSSRARGPLLRIDCATTSDLNLESASGGTVILDEVGEMSLGMQMKLFAILESKSSDVRIIASTKRDLFTSARDGSFRRDLYDRLNGIGILIPPLRERPREIPAFAQRFLEHACAKIGKQAPAISRETLGYLMRQPYFGNLRELRGTMDRAAVLCRGNEVRPDHLVFESASSTAPVTLQTLPPTAPGSSYPPPAPVVIPKIPAPAPMPAPAPIPAPPEDPERDRILRALDECSGNQTRAAALLGISRRTLSARIEQYGLPRPKKR